MRLRRLAAATAGLLALAPVLVACGDDAAEIEVGDVIPARDDAQFVEGTASSLALPIGRLEVFMGKPTRKLGVDDTRQREATDAPDDATFVPNTWRYDDGTFGTLKSYLGDEQTPTVELVSDKASYRLPAPASIGEGSDSFYVPVTGAGEHPRLRVEYDGVTQTVDLATGERKAGRAAPLYDLPERTGKARPCHVGADFHGAGGISDYQCKVTRPIRLPYAAGRWAPKGHEYLAVTVTTAIRRLDIFGFNHTSGGTYVPDAVRSTFRYGKAKSIMAAQDVTDLCPNLTKGGCTGRYHVVFDVTGHQARRLTIDQTFQMKLGSQWGDFDRKDRMKLKVTTGLQLR